MKQGWPFPRDGVLVRSRKMALAFREEAKKQRQVTLMLRDILLQADRRLIAYSDPAMLPTISAAIDAVASKDPVTELDERFVSWGEEWHADLPDNYDMDDWVKTSVAARLVQIASKTLNQMRIDGKVTGKWDPSINTKGGYLYRVGDVFAARAAMPGRGWRVRDSIDTLNNSGTGDSKCAGE